jgi:hypothetical protein
MADDYFEEVEADVREEQRKDPGVVLPWSWWEDQGKRHGMSANAVYTRAVKIGLYTPPAKRQSDGNGSSAPRAEERTAPPSERAEIRRDPLPSPAPAYERAAAPPPRAEERTEARSPSKPASSLGNVGEAIHDFVALVERTAGLERRIEELTRDLERSRSENRRLRKAMRQVEDLLDQLRQTSRNALLLPEEDPS